MVLISLRGHAGWSTPLLFVNTEDRFSRAEAHMSQYMRFWYLSDCMGAQWLSGRMLDSRPKGSGFEPHRRDCVVVLEQDTFILA